ncbi:hypothetical protein P879_07629, partial [Paragonimus westermani]
PQGPPPPYYPPGCPPAQNCPPKYPLQQNQPVSANSSGYPVGNAYPIQPIHPFQTYAYPMAPVPPASNDRPPPYVAPQPGSGQTIVVPGVTFDGGSRFSQQCPPTIPPPPPGYAPNPAQQLAQAGYNVQVNQSGHSKTGGWTFW